LSRLVTMYASAVGVTYSTSQLRSITRDTQLVTTTHFVTSQLIVHHVIYLWYMCMPRCQMIPIDYPSLGALSRLAPGCMAKKSKRCQGRRALMVSGHSRDNGAMARWWLEEAAGEQEREQGPILSCLPDVSVGSFH